jgi:beta-glucosidase
VSDWQAQHSGVDSALAGLDLAMPGDTLFDTGDSYYGSNLTVAVLNGTVCYESLGNCFRDILTRFFRT